MRGDKLEWEYRDGIKSKGDKIMTACTHSTVIEDARNSQPKRSNATSPILSHQAIITMKLHNHRMLEREEVNHRSD